LVAVVALAVWCSLNPAPRSAEALSVKDLLKGGTNQVSDEDRVYLIDRIGAVKGQVDVGDSIRGHVGMNTLNDSAANLGGTTGNNEWTGVYQFLVLAKVPLGAGIFSFVLGPDPAFEADLGGGMTGPIGFVPGTGAMVVMFESSTINFASDFVDPTSPTAGPDDGTVARTVPPSSADVSTGPYATEETFIATATDGTYFWTLGFGGPDGPGTSAPGPGQGVSLVTLPLLGDNILSAFTFTSGSTGGVLNAGLNRLFNGNVGSGDNINLGTVVTPFPGSPAAQFAFSTDVRGVSDLDTSFEASSNTNASFSIIPEPASMMLVGAGLLGLGLGAGVRRIRRK
jgi:hypothetical protein